MFPNIYHNIQANSTYFRKNEKLRADVPIDQPHIALLFHHQIINNIPEIKL